MAKEKISKEAKYKVFRSLWFTKKPANFVEIPTGIFLVKFGAKDVKTRIRNLAPWLFDQCLFALTPFIKDQEIKEYTFDLVPFLIQIYNIPFDRMDRQVALKVGGVVGKVLATNWRDREGCWIDYIRVRVKLDVAKLLRRVVYMLGVDGKEIVCTIKYERLPTFCYMCDHIGHNTQRCERYTQGMSSDDYQYESWMLVQVG